MLFSLIIVLLLPIYNFAATCHEEEVLDPSERYCFIVSKNEKSYRDAEQDCYAYGGFRLAVIPSRIDNNFLWNISMNSGVFSNYFWIGATDITLDGTWQWIDGSPMNFKNWASGAFGKGSCAVMRVSDGRWQPYDCEMSIPFFCYGPAQGAPTDPPTTPKTTLKPTRKETVLIKFIGDAESVGDPNTDPNAKNFYNKQRDFIKNVSDYLFTHQQNGNNFCKYYASPAFYGYSKYQQQFSTGAAWGQGQFDSLLEGNQWDEKTDHVYNITDAITGVQAYSWSPPLNDLGYTTLVFFTARQNFDNIPSLFNLWPKFDETIVISMKNSSMSIPFGVQNIPISEQFNEDDLQAVVSQLQCH